jgi:hypothetical protein
MISASAPSFAPGLAFFGAAATVATLERLPCLEEGRATNPLGWRPVTP